MTAVANCEDIGKKLNEAHPGSVLSTDKGTMLVEASHLPKVAQLLRHTGGFEFDYLTFVTAVDYLDYFEVVYRLVSLKLNQTVVLKTRCSRGHAVLPSVVDFWRAAYYQEREIYDLFGIIFEGHPDMRRLLLWEGFVGHPLRRDYL